MCKCVLSPGDNPIAVNKYIDINCLTSKRVSTNLSLHNMFVCEYVQLLIRDVKYDDELSEVEKGSVEVIENCHYRLSRKS